MLAAAVIRAAMGDNRSRAAADASAVDSSVGSFTMMMVSFFFYPCRVSSPPTKDPEPSLFADSTLWGRLVADHSISSVLFWPFATSSILWLTRKIPCQRDSKDSCPYNSLNTREAAV